MLEERLTPHPFSTFQSPLRLANPVGNGRPATYIVCNNPIYGPLQAARDWVKANGKSHNMETVEIAAGHDAMIIAPRAVADLIDS